MIEFILFVTLLLISITFHEYAHGFIAAKLGDPTPEQSGRLTLNPLAHIDIFGTVILPVFLYKMGLPPFGYAKPVPINPYHFKNPRKDIMWVGLAGPSANFIIAVILSIFVRILYIPHLSEVLIWAILINVVLAVFNLVPIPPLDGSKIIASFLPAKISHNYLRLQIYGFVFIIILVNIGFFQWFIIPIVKTILAILGLGAVL
ncbi:MAG: site-2 protease family protein [Candidatus Omnitrophica bacterium]|nr:site-2 protease family protein [Candidatus Omnitrophota bacterium]